MSTHTSKIGPCTQCGKPIEIAAFDDPNRVRCYDCRHPGWRDVQIKETRRQNAFRALSDDPHGLMEKVLDDYLLEAAKTSPEVAKALAAKIKIVERTR